MTRHDQIECWLTGMDGVLVHEKQALPGAAELLQQWRAANQPYLVLTNNSIFTPRVVGAEARIVDGVDAAMTINLAFEGDATAQVHMNIGDEAETSIELSVTGSTGELHMRMPYHPTSGGSSR